MIQKFRAWDKKNNIMLAVNTICNLFWDNTFIECYEMVPDPKNIHEYELIDHKIDLEDAILMQSTGLFCKNGKEIFEGDIVRVSMLSGKHTTISIGAVKFDKYQACFKIINDLGSHYVTLFHTMNFEVIGDIYQNPELVEEETYENE